MIFLNTKCFKRRMTRVNGHGEAEKRALKDVIAHIHCTPMQCNGKKNKKCSQVMRREFVETATKVTRSKREKNVNVRKK